MIVHAAARHAQNGVEPDRVADGDQIGLVRNVQTQRIALGGGGGNGGAGQGLPLGCGVHVHGVHQRAAVVMHEQVEAVALQGVGGAGGLLLYSYFNLSFL